MSRMTASRTTARKNDAARECRAGGAEAPARGSHEHVLLVLSRLEAAYGHESSPADMYATGEPLDGLILTLLSQNTNDKNRDAAYESLRRAYPRWSDVAAAPQAAVAAAIKSAGLGDIKAERMKAILPEILSRFGSYSLAALKEWDGGSVREYLSGMRGIGPKTVACVMAFDLGLPAFPVDTHVARISRRLGWAGEKSPPERIQGFLESTVPPGRCGGGHLNMIEHGRKVCHARKPDCGKCVASDLCLFYEASGLEWVSS